METRTHRSSTWKSQCDLCELRASVVSRRRFCIALEP
jgi:hypothetical protein